MPDFSEVPDGFERLLRDVDHEAPSTAKYRPFERYLAELLGLPAADIYTAYVSKRANFDVRLTQSHRARRARLRVALLPSEANLAQVMDLAIRTARSDYPGTAVLLVCDTPDGWAPRWGIEPEATGQPSDLPANLSRFRGWPGGFELETYPYRSPGDGPAVQETLDALLADVEEPQTPEQVARRALLTELSAIPHITEALYRIDPGLFTRLIETDVTAHDVVAIERRRDVVRRFRRLLEDPQFFSKAAEEFGGRKEAVWQKLLEENPWILGVSLTGQLLTSWRLIHGKRISTCPAC